MNNKFDDIRPYNEEEFPAAMQRIAHSEAFPLLASFVYPNDSLVAVRERICSFKTIREFQHDTMWNVNEQIIARSTTEFSGSGLEKLSRDKRYLYVSNHRDIVLDACLLQYFLVKNGFETTEITFGANLMQHPVVIDAGKSNKMFRVERPGGDLKEFYRASNGKPIGYFWGFKTAGLFQNQQEIKDWIAAGNGVYQSDPQPGDVKYYDINHDGVINDSDKVNLGNGMPDFTFGFSLGFDWKGLDFSVTANGQTGNKIVQSYRNVGSATANYTTQILDRWTGEGTSNKIPRVTNTNVNYQFSDLFIQDGDFLRISNITLGYDFSRLLRQKWLSQARLYFQVQNAFTFTKYDGMDPEIGYGMDGWVSGVDLGYYPRPRTFLFGVNLKF